MFENTLKQRIATIWIFISLVCTLVNTAVGGAGDVNPTSCYGAFFVTLATTVPIAVLNVLCCPIYFVPMRNVASVILDVSGALGGLVFLYVLMDDSQSLEEAQPTIAFAQALSTLPAATIGTAMSVLGVLRVALLRLGKAKIVTRTALREHLPKELDIAERKLLGKERKADAGGRRNFLGIDTSWFFED